MTVKKIYEKYQVPPNLQQHMLRIAGVAKVIFDSWKGEKLNSEIIIKASLFHDMGNILKFDLVNKVSFLGEEAKNVEHWRKVKSEMAQKYGPDEHMATVMICRELNLSPKILWIIENWGFGNFDKVLTSDSWEYKICVYADHRVGPFGVVSLADRFAEQRKRYEQQQHGSIDLSAHLSDKSEILANCAFKIEKQLQEKIKKDLETIMDKEIETNFNKFLLIEL